MYSIAAAIRMLLILIRMINAEGLARDFVLGRGAESKA